jgi:hypothetical protein
MKRIMAAVLYCFAAFITFGSALARAQTLQAKIPFAFVVRGKVLPPGTYRIHAVGNNLIEVRAKDNSAVETSTTHANNHGSVRDSTLVFSKYGEQYFLREILCESANLSSALPASKLETSAQIREARLRPEQTVAAIR